MEAGEYPMHPEPGYVYIKRGGRYYKYRAQDVYAPSLTHLPGSMDPMAHAIPTLPVSVLTVIFARCVWPGRHQGATAVGDTVETWPAL